MKHFQKNPRQITEKEMDQLKKDLKELGDLGGFVHDVGTDEIISGNMRSEAIPGILSGELKPVIVKQYDKPNKQGTVAVGFIEFEGEQFKYRQVKWTESKRNRANIRANLAGGYWDFDLIANEWNLYELIDFGMDEDFYRDWKSQVGALGVMLESENIQEIDAPELKDGDRTPFRQVTFTLHDEQWEEVQKAVSKAKEQGGAESAVNENTNGNALAFIAQRFNRGRC